MSTRGRLARVGHLEVETLHPLTNFFPFFRPSQNPSVLPPHASSTVAPTSVPPGFTGKRRRSGAIRFAVRRASALEPSPALRADLVYLAFALEIQGFCDVAPRKPCPEILSSSIVTSVKPASLS